MTSVLCITCAIGPYFSAAFSLPSSDSIIISVTITSAPASAKARASARPRPRDAPVTTATLPANKLAPDDINLPPIFHHIACALLFERVLLAHFLVLPIQMFANGFYLLLLVLVLLVNLLHVSGVCLGPSDRLHLRLAALANQAFLFLN